MFLFRHSSDSQISEYQLQTPHTTQCRNMYKCLAFVIRCGIMSTLSIYYFKRNSLHCIVWNRIKSCKIHRFIHLTALWDPSFRSLLLLDWLVSCQLSVRIGIHTTTHPSCWRRDTVRVLWCQYDTGSYIDIVFIVIQGHSVRTFSVRGL